MKKLLYYIVYALIYGLSLLPFRVLYVLSDFFYLLAYYVIRYRRKIVRKNLTDSFPEKTEDEIRRIERGFYKWFCDYMVESLKMMTISKEEMMRRCTFKGTELLDEAIEKGQSCGLYLGHYCNWEWVTALPLYLKSNPVCGEIYHVLENADFDRLFKHMRERFGSICIPMAETLRVITKYKQQGKPVIIGYIADQVPFWNNIHYWTDFLNHDTPVLTGTEKILRRLDHAIFYVDGYRPRRGYYEWEFKLITYEPTKMKEFEITEQYCRMLEKNIQRQPEFWLWSHNRWKRGREEWLRDHVDQETGRVYA